MQFAFINSNVLPVPSSALPEQRPQRLTAAALTVFLPALFAEVGSIEAAADLLAQFGRQTRLEAGMPPPGSDNWRLACEAG